jgi:hypothetical protein
MTYLMKTTSSLALVAAAGMMATSAMAADLGGNCCTDLEERVAELEATTARKGNRKVSLQIYGQVSEAIIWWNDGAESNVYVLENNNVQNRVGFQGNAKINSDWSAGYKLELQVRAYRSASSNQLSLGTSNNVQIPAYNTQSITIREAHWFLRSNHYGTITVGRSADAVSGTSSITLVNPDGFSGLNGPGFANGGYLLRQAGTTGRAGLSSLTWQNFSWIRNGDGPTPMDYATTSASVKYTSPFFLGQTKSSGFQFSAGWGMDDAWSVALRYAEQFGRIRVAAGIGYSMWTGLDRGMCSTGEATSGSTTDGTRESNTDCNSLQVSASILDTSSGLYLSGGYARMDDRLSQRALNTALGNVAGSIAAAGPAQGDSSAWWVQAGWQARLNPLGSTIFWGQWTEYDTGLGVASSNVQTLATGDAINATGGTALIAGTSTQVWSLGISQNIEAAAMTLYAGFHNYETSGTLIRQSTGVRSSARPIDDMQLFYTGATIRF